MVAILPTIQIISDPKLREGQPIIEGTAIRVADLARCLVDSPPHTEDKVAYLADLFNMPISKIYAGLSYYYQNQQEIDAVIEKDAALHQWIITLVASNEELTAVSHPELNNFSDESLWQIVYERGAWEQYQELDRLSSRSLTDEEKNKLESLLLIDRRLTLLRSKAMLILHQRGYDIKGLLGAS